MICVKEESTKRYSRTYNGKLTSGKIRYNYSDSCMELLYDGNVEFSLGLNPSEWKDNPRYWVDKFDEEVSNELNYSTEFL